MLKKAAIVQKAKTTEHTRTERQVLEHIRQSPFLVTLHYAFQTQSKLHLILGETLGWDTGKNVPNIENSSLLKHWRSSLCFCLILYVFLLAFLFFSFLHNVCLCSSLYYVYSSSLCICLCVSTDYVSGGEMFTHLYQRDHFPEEAVRIYIGEIILALEHLHKVRIIVSNF